jgi:hypothetical protein
MEIFICVYAGSSCRPVRESSEQAQIGHGDLVSLHSKATAAPAPDEQPRPGSTPDRHDFVAGRQPAAARTTCPWTGELST